MPDNQPVYHCEQCSKPLFPGDMAQIDSEGAAMCPDHAAGIADFVAFWEADLQSDAPLWPDAFLSLDHLHQQIDSWKGDMAAHGNIRPLVEV